MTYFAVTRLQLSTKIQSYWPIHLSDPKYKKPVKLDPQYNQLTHNIMDH